MAIDLTNQTALITGSTDGLGKLLAIELAKHKANVIVHGKNEVKIASVISNLKEINPTGKHNSVVCDFRTPESISNSFSKIRNLDILVNNAGVWLEGNTIDAPEEKILELTNVNLISAMMATKTLLPVLLKSKFGQILNVSSVAGIEIPFDYYHTIYTATKFGVQGFSEALSKEFNDKNLRVMGFYPGGMETKIFEKAGNEYEDHEPWMFDPQESVDAMIFMLTRNKKVNVKRMDLLNHLQA